MATINVSPGATTIQTALTTGKAGGPADPGDMLLLADGNYPTAGPWSIDFAVVAKTYAKNVAGAAATELTIRAANPGMAIIDLTSATNDTIRGREASEYGGGGESAGIVWSGLVFNGSGSVGTVIFDQAAAGRYKDWRFEDCSLTNMVQTPFRWVTRPSNGHVYLRIATGTGFNSANAIHYGKGSLASVPELGLRIDSCDFRTHGSSTTEPISLGSVSKVRINNCLFTGVTGQGIRVNSATGLICGDMFINGCTFTNPSAVTTGAAIDIEPAAGIIEDVHVYDCEVNDWGRGVELDSGDPTAIVRYCSVVNVRGRQTIPWTTGSPGNTSDFLVALAANSYNNYAANIVANGWQSAIRLHSGYRNSAEGVRAINCRSLVHFSAYAGEASDRCTIRNSVATGCAYIYYLEKLGGGNVTEGFPTSGNYKASAITAVAAGGINYVVGDTITLDGGTSVSKAVLVVVRVTAGVIQEASIRFGGLYTVVPSNPVAQNSTSGSGTGATFTMVFSAGMSHRTGKIVYTAPVTAYALVDAVSKTQAQFEALYPDSIAVSDTLVTSLPTAGLSIQAALAYLVDPTGSAANYSIQRSANYLGTLKDSGVSIQSALGDL